MTERPIIFSGPMVRAILDGRKTQTRRVVKPQPRDHDFGPGGIHPALTGRNVRNGMEAVGCHIANKSMHYVRCPFGEPGDRLWVREAWQRFFDDEVPAGHRRGPRDTMGQPSRPDRLSYIYYRADGEMDHPGVGRPHWMSPIHMPRRMSRITLQVESVRVDRLQAITTSDIRSEGVQLPVAAVGFDPISGRQFPPGKARPLLDIGSRPGPDEVSDKHPRDWAVDEYWRHAWAIGWDRINGKRAPWASNPWLWVVSFSLVQQ